MQAVSGIKVSGILLLFILFTLGLFNIRCGVLDSSGDNNHDQTDGGNPPFIDGIIPIESDIIFSVKEGYEDNDSAGLPKTVLSMSSGGYPCANYSLVYNASTNTDTVSIDFSGIDEPDVCLTAIGSAKGVSFLDISNGEYSLNFTYDGVEDGYILSITDSYIEVYEQTAKFTTPEYELFWRYPPNSFAYLCGTTTDTAWICDDFVATLIGGVSLQEFQFPAYGKIPYPAFWSDTPARYFYYGNDRDFADAGDILQTYTRNVINNYSGVSILLISWKNESHRSWLMGN